MLSTDGFCLIHHINYWYLLSKPTTESTEMLPHILLWIQDLFCKCLLCLRNSHDLYEVMEWNPNLNEVNSKTTVAFSRIRILSMKFFLFCVIRNYYLYIYFFLFLNNYYQGVLDMGPMRYSSTSKVLSSVYPFQYLCFTVPYERTIAYCFNSLGGPVITWLIL